MASVARRKATSNNAVAPAAPRGADCVAVVELTGKDGTLLAAVGEVCERVPDDAIAWLLECGAVVPVHADVEGGGQ